MSATSAYFTGTVVLSIDGGSSGGGGTSQQSETAGAAPSAAVVAGSVVAAAVAVAAIVYGTIQYLVLSKAPVQVSDPVYGQQEMSCAGQTVPQRQHDEPPRSV